MLETNYLNAMQHFLLRLACFGCCCVVLAKADMLLAQASNITVTNPTAAAVLAGSFTADDFPGGETIDLRKDLAQALIAELSPDTLKQLLLELNTFGNRNIGSDTVSTSSGIGAARRWAHDRMAGFGASGNGRLQLGYVQFDQLVCDMQQHRNVLAVLPGTGAHANEVVLIEGHLDSRCEGVCDIDCQADGMEDNASGSVLVMELARVLSKYRFDRTLAFMLTTGEEQGLIGAAAFADYCVDEDIKVVAVLNNDVIGGVICGETASPPGCPGLNDIDSINVRLYAATSAKNLARYTKHQYDERVAPQLAVPSIVNIMSGEDRAGRGGDHIPFRQRGYPAIRFTSANEHGNANVNDPDYHDRQHTSEDVLGVDTDNDGQLDSFFVNFRYLYRNAVINGEAAGMLATADTPPAGITSDDIDHRVAIAIDDPLQRDSFTLAIRNSSSLEWDTLVRIAAIDTVEVGIDRWYFSAAYLDDQGLLTQFTDESTARVRVSSTGEVVMQEEAIELLQNVPNPFDEATMIRVVVNQPVAARAGQIVVHDINGRELTRLEVGLQPGINEVLYDFRNHDFVPGTYSYSLTVEGQVVATRWMVYAW